MKISISLILNVVIIYFILNGAVIYVHAEVETSIVDPAPEIVKFTIKTFQVQGNTLFSNNELALILNQFTGINRDFGDVQHALEALETFYHRQGYNTVQIYLPEQELVDGIVRLNVIEAKIREVQIKNNLHFSKENIRNSIPNLYEGKLTNLNEVSASLRIANENPAKKITLEMQATDNDDQIDALINVQDEKPWRVSLNIDNTGSPQSGKIHYGAALQYANIANLDHVLNLQYTTSSDGLGVGIYGFGYHAPLYQLGDSLDLFAGYSDVDSGSINGSPITGRGSVFGVRYNQDLGRQDDYIHRLIYGIDYRDYQGIKVPDNIEIVHPVTVLPITLNYTCNWNLPTMSSNFSITAFRNLPAGNHGKKRDFITALQITRPDVSGTAKYSGIRYNANLNYALPVNWLLRGALTGQYTSNVLIPGEQIGLAGANAVRGFPERDVATDRGNFLNLEIYTPDLCNGRWETNCRLLTFIDQGRGYSKGIGGVAIGSAGLGLRLNINKTLNLEANGAQVLNQGGTQQKNDRYLHLQVGVNF